MYWEFFGFKEPPFALTPNPAFLFLSAPHQEAFAHLLFAIENRAGFIELSGEVGTGKTTIVRTLLNHLDRETHRTALIFNPTLSPLGLFREINGEFGLPTAGNDLQELHQALNAFLLEENRAGNTVVLVIDEAQNLSIEVLEQIRLISNLETDRSKLIQIVLVGQPELRTLLARAELRQLDQRITVRYHLKPMQFSDTCDYIRHRIRFAAGGSEPLSFTPGAIDKIFRFSGGLPRLINSACDRALLVAYTSECREVSPAMAAASIADLRKDAPRSARIWPKAMAAALVLAALLAGIWLALPGRGGAPAEKVEKVAEQAGSPKTSAQTAADKVSAQAGPALSRDLALKGLAAVSEEENQREALNAVLGAWRSPQFDQGQPGASLATLARQRGMTATRIQGDLDAVARLDTPALLHVSVPGVGHRLVALIGLGKDGVRVVPALGGRSTLTRAELALVWSAGATLIWKDFNGIAARVKPEERAAAVRLLQGLLKGAGCYQVSGTLRPKTSEAVAEFQRREGLVVDGKARGITLLLLYRRAGGFFPPALSGEAAGKAGTGKQAAETGAGKQAAETGAGKQALRDEIARCSA
jgi:general secretion pathway protein A